MAANEISQYADALGFLAPQGQQPYADPAIAEYLDLVHVTAAPPNLTTTGQTLAVVQGYAEVIEDQRELWLADDKQSLQRALELPGRTAVILGLQHTPADVLEAGNLDDLYGAGIRVMAPEYKAGNGPFGSGFLDPEGSLKPAGRLLLEAMATRQGMIVDLSHLGEQTANETLDYIEKLGLPLNVMASHGGVRDFYDGQQNAVNNLRNLSLATLQRLKKFGAVAGMCTLTFAMSDSDNTPQAFIEQVRQASEVLPDLIVIGSDGIYTERDPIEWAQSFRDMSKMLPEVTDKTVDITPRHPDTPFELNGVDRMVRIEAMLLDAGINRDEVSRIVGKRLVDFFLRAL